MWCVESLNLFYDRHGANRETAMLAIQVLPSLFTQTAFSLAHWFVTLFWFHFRMSPFVNLNFKLFWLKAQAFYEIVDIAYYFIATNRRARSCSLVSLWCDFGVRVSICASTLWMYSFVENRNVFYFIFFACVYVFHSLTQFKLY